MQDLLSQNFKLWTIKVIFKSCVSVCCVPLIHYYYLLTLIIYITMCSCCTLNTRLILKQQTSHKNLTNSSALFKATAKIISLHMNLMHISKSREETQSLSINSLFARCCQAAKVKWTGVTCYSTNTIKRQQKNKQRRVGKGGGCSQELSHMSFKVDLVALKCGRVMCCINMWFESGVQA